MGSSELEHRLLCHVLTMAGLSSTSIIELMGLLLNAETARLASRRLLNINQDSNLSCHSYCLKLSLSQRKYSSPSEKTNHSYIRGRTPAYRMNGACLNRFCRRSGQPSRLRGCLRPLRFLRVSSPCPKFRGVAERVSLSIRCIFPPWSLCKDAASRVIDAVDEAFEEWTYHLDMACQQRVMERECSASAFVSCPSGFDGQHS